MHILKNLANSLKELFSIFLFNNLIINKFVKLVIIDRGKRIKKISTML